MSGATSDPGPGSAGRAWTNLILLIAGGVSISWWLIRHTELFPLVGGLLGLGGLFSWIAFVGNVLLPERKAALQTSFDRVVLRSATATLVLAGGLALFWLGLVPAFSTLVLDGLALRDSRLVTVSRPEGPVVARLRLAAAGRYQLPLVVGWFGRASYRVKVAGLPPATVTVRGGHRVPLEIPAALLHRPVILVRPGAELLGTIEGVFDLALWVDDREVARIPGYDGSAVLLGSDGDLDLPAALTDHWRLELLAARLDPAAAVGWQRLQAVLPELPLPAGSQVRAALVRPADNRVVYTGAAAIPGRTTPDHFLLEVVIHGH